VCSRTTRIDEFLPGRRAGCFLAARSRATDVQQIPDGPWLADATAAYASGQFSLRRSEADHTVLSAHARIRRELVGSRAIGGAPACDRLAEAGKHHHRNARRELEVERTARLSRDEGFRVCGRSPSMRPPTDPPLGRHAAGMLASPRSGRRTPVRPACLFRPAAQAPAAGRRPRPKLTTSN